MTMGGRVVDLRASAAKAIRRWSLTGTQLVLAGAVVLG